MALLKRAARVAVASSVHGRVQRRQQQRWAQQDTAAAAAAQPTAQTPVAAPLAAAPTAGAIDDQLARLAQLGQLRDAGVLTDAEFEAKKAQILAL
ncbi:SHOCT domain-containing protein [Gordonia sp. PDNC005]|uniref:SHOCT domain-containing protein n=1 Tax=unclassified Gordonia (in: high G+C Gram-positive bacteria) TaxID=2657482 RepID=UPI0019641680|nr:SHOCT domain-containing protein [Gordonia sp. PDNC005]QRY60919.1 SHOCT domain-containing protein [Gordonia sp. PDNC005]